MKISREKFLAISIIFLSIITGNLVAQDSSSTEYQQIRFFKLNQSNDLYTYLYQSDKYFTDGVNFELAHPVFNNKVSDYFLLGFKETPYRDFSLSFNQDMYTPENTQATEVDSTDRPYAGQLYATYAKYTNQFFKGRKITSRLFFGIQGPWALGKQAQNGVHSAINNEPVKGWDNQLSNGLIFDYELNYMQLIPVSSPITELHYFGIAHIGTLNNFIEAGIRFKIGRFTDSYMNFYGIANPRMNYNFKADDIAKMSPSRRKTIPKRIRALSLEDQAKYINKKLNRKFQLYFFTEATASYFIYDGSVQGSLIQFSPNTYELSYSDYEHSEILGRYGVVIQYSHFYLEYARYLQNDIYKEVGVFGYGKMILSWVF